MILRSLAIAPACDGIGANQLSLIPFLAVSRETKSVKGVRILEMSHELTSETEFWSWHFSDSLNDFIHRENAMNYLSI